MAYSLQTLESPRGSNDPARELLRRFGLRSSLIRFKVINALIVAQRDGQGLGARGVHCALVAQSRELLFISVREVLKRLCEDGVLCLHVDKRYRFTPLAWEVLLGLGMEVA
ncbi:fe2+ zn2+ uptake regulation protein [Pseudomonas sp. 148P]|uniref:Fe2+ zn2+ uptake regulation protein n=1 Tax=Pseudomonas ulcerans TaxID=3115852 RepID=A0ABU7HNP5_9PSED|nr:MULTISPECIES: fe2+ zn2+ uptake regulation protein [unclassified Pseudomonas]MEE1923664.1 fe2+ zn2+ uptake regulation protein [Pseudomonas sp. 147P]MEE1933162.1 fe2+ zn2+ uptake regulation protein [Pseudomonas sp. 148P]